MPAPKSGSAYSINRGLWGVTIGGSETLDSKETIPESAWELSSGAFSSPLNEQKIFIKQNNEEEIIDIKGPEHLFFFEAELASQSIAKEKVQAPHPAMNWEDTLGNLKMEQFLKQFKEIILNTQIYSFTDIQEHNSSYKLETMLV